MATLQELTAAPLKVTVGGRDYFISPLTDKDKGALLIWLRNDYIAVARAAVKDEKEAIRTRVLSEASDRAAKLALFDGEGYSLIISKPGGIAYQLWLSLRHEHSAITLEEVEQIIQDPEAIEVCFEAIETVTLQSIKKKTHPRIQRRLKKLSKRKQRRSIRETFTGLWRRGTDGRSKQSQG